MRYSELDQLKPVQTTPAQDEQIKHMTQTDCINYLFAIMGGAMNGGNKKAR